MSERSPWATDDMTPCPKHGLQHMDASGRCIPSCGWGWEVTEAQMIRMLVEAERESGR